MTETPTYVLPLADPRATLETAGGKGASLARLVNAGLPVPDGFHVTTAAYRRFVADNNLQPAILEAVRAADPAQPATLETASRAIARLFAGAPLPSGLAEAIAHAYASLPGEEPAVAVRSSATAEDLPGLSFAGQQETYLNIRGLPAVRDAVQRCWASLWTARAIGYRAQHGIDQGAVSLAVVVQALVPAEAAGIMFTADPMSGRRDRATITATWGLGEAIVGGLVTPDTLTVEKASGQVLERQTADKQLMTVRAAGGTAEQPVPEARRRAPVLDDQQAAELCGLGVRIEAQYGLPMDIEWALAPSPGSLGSGSASTPPLPDGFAILQARPITALPPEPAAPLHWALPRPNGKYARSSIIELLPEPLTPLFATLGVGEINRAYVRFGERAFRVSRPDSIVPWPFVLLICDYAYYDVAFNARQLLALLIKSPAVMKFLLSTAERRWKEQGRPRYAGAVARWQHEDLAALPARALLNAARELFGVAMDYYIYTVQAGVLPAAYMSETVFTWFYEKLIRKTEDPPALAFVLGFDSLPIRAEQSLYDLAQWCRELPALAGRLAGASSGQIAAWLDDRASLPADLPTEDWSAFQERFAAHLERFGHAIYDLDFAKPVPADDPSPLLETLKHLIQGQGTDPHRRQQEASRRREEAVRRAGARVRGWRRSWFERLLRWAQRYAPLREDALGDVGLGWPLLRRMLRELGRRLAAAGAIRRPEDVFWLTESEVAALAGELDGARTQLAGRRPEVDERRARIERESRHTPPPSLPSKVTFAGVGISRWLPARAEQQAGNTIKGIGASPGSVTATARVLRGPEDFGQMQHGDVLVAAITTPAWTPLFALAAGVVTDVGGPLSHSSIVAREYGVPAVLGTGVATRRIHSGDTITVDGSAGVVTLPRGSA